MRAYIPLLPLGRHVRVRNQGSVGGNKVAGGNLDISSMLPWAEPPAVATAWRACSMQGSRPTWVELCYPHCPLRGAFELHYAQAGFCVTGRQKSGDEFTARTLMDSGCGTCWHHASQSELHFLWPVFCSGEPSMPGPLF